MRWRFLAAAVAALAAMNAGAMVVAGEKSDVAAALLSAGVGVSVAVESAPATDRAVVVRVGVAARSVPPPAAASSADLAGPYDVMASLGAGAEPADDVIGFADQPADDVSLYAWMLAGLGLIGVLYRRRTQD